MVKPDYLVIKDIRDIRTSLILEITKSASNAYGYEPETAIIYSLLDKVVRYGVKHYLYLQFGIGLKTIHYHKENKDNVFFNEIIHTTENIFYHWLFDQKFYIESGSIVNTLVHADTVFISIQSLEGV